MKTYLFILFVGLCMLCSPAAAVLSLTVNGETYETLPVKIGQAVQIEIRSDDASLYEAYAGFDEGTDSLGVLSNPVAYSEAGSSADITLVSPPSPPLEGYYMIAAGTGRTAGLHFSFTYTADTVGQTVLKLYDGALATVQDSITIAVYTAQAGTAFTYQGRLLDDNIAADGSYDMVFTLLDAPMLGDTVGTPVELEDVEVIDGYFVATLDFGSDIFTGEARWLEIEARPGDSTADHTVLSPRQLMTPTPYAIYAETTGDSSEDSDWILSGNDMYSGVSGKVGIGTDTPASKLHCSGNGAYSYYGVAPSDNSFNLILEAPASGTGMFGGIQFNNTGNSQDRIAYIGAINNDWTNRKLSLVFGTDDGTTQAERMRLTESGKLGIGIMNPAAKLHCVGNGAYSYYGVAPGDNSFNIIIEAPASGKGMFGGIKFNNTGNSQDRVGYIGTINESGTNQDLSMVFGTDGSGSSTEKMRITGSGNVGIGTLTPVYTLDVEGDIRATGSVYYGGTAGSVDGTAYTKPDYVFEPGYAVMTTEAVAQYLHTENHLPWMTSAKQEKQENGYSVDMTRMAFETVETTENLQMQIIELHQQNKILKQRLEAQEKILHQLQAMLKKGDVQ